MAVGRAYNVRVADNAPDELDNEREPYLDDQWTWASEQAAALRRRDPDALDWEHLVEEIDGLASGIRCDWLSHCILAVENMLLIEHYPAPAEQVSLWRAKAWRRRCDLGYVHRDNPGLAGGQLDALLAESWLIARRDAISSMAKLDSTGLHSWEWKDDSARWDRYLPPDLPYTFEEILGRDPARRYADPSPDRWPAGVKRKLLEVFGPELDLPGRLEKWRPRNPVSLH